MNTFERSHLLSPCLGFGIGTSVTDIVTLNGLQQQASIINTVIFLIAFCINIMTVYKNVKLSATDHVLALTVVIAAVMINWAVHLPNM